MIIRIYNLKFHSNFFRLLGASEVYLTTNGGSVNHIRQYTGGTENIIYLRVAEAGGDMASIIWSADSAQLASRLALTTQGTAYINLDSEQAIRIAGDVGTSHDGTVRWYDRTNASYVGVSAPSAVSASYDMILPAAQGTANQYLENDGAGNLSWVSPGSGFTSPLTTKGDIFGFTTVDARLAVGTNGQHLEADSTQATGLKWVDEVTEFADGDFRIYKSGDTTAKILFKATAVSTGVSRQIIMPDANVDLGDIEQALKQSIILACSDETTDLTTGTAKLTFRMPYGFDLTNVRASVTTAPTGSVLTVDINESGTTILSTKLTIDAGEKTSTTAATPVVISDSSLADDAEITIDIDTIGSTIAGAGLKITLLGTKA